MPPNTQNSRPNARSRRICVIGSSGSGKTTLARQAATLLAVPHVELDALHWNADWQEAPTALFRQRVDAALSGPGWTVDGNYSQARDLVWGRADTLVWLDYSFPVTFSRLLRRTAGRIVAQNELWNGNRESLRMSLSRDSILLWLLRTYARHRREFPHVLAQPEWSHLTIHRLRTPREAGLWLETLSGI